MASVTIVTAVLNRRAMLSEAVASIPPPRRGALEHLVVDGGSTDGTRELVLADPALTLIDAPGSGVYDAMAIGIRAARGQWVGLLNSDDWMADGAFEALELAISRQPDADIITGRAEVFDPATGARAAAGQEADWQLEPRQIILGAVSINARFIRKEAFLAAGGFDLRYAYGADRHLLLKMARLGVRNHVVPHLFYRYRSHPGSLTFLPSRDRRVTMAREQAQMIAEALADPATPRSWRQGLREAQAITVARLASLGPEGGLAVIGRHWMADPAFPLRLGIGVARGLSRRNAARLRAEKSS